MKVHIVIWQDNHIIPRMAEWLVEHNGWTMSERPDNSADINYYLPYLQWNTDNHPQTMTAAWFTHFEEGTDWKVKKWYAAAQAIDFPLITTNLYQGMLPHAKLVTPGVDLDLFTAQEQQNHDIPVVGIAGVGQPRKGPHLLLDLYYSSLTCYISIIGSNWPFQHHRGVAAEEMPAFYKQIDVLLCSSLIEGIPAPVLEALACDRKVVMPWDVGIGNYLPEMPGIRHFKKGDSQSMINALAQAFVDKPDPGTLRHVAEDYSIKAWCESHWQAMQEMVNAALPL